MNIVHQTRALARLADLSRLKRDAEMAKLARIGQTRDRLLCAIERLRQTEAPLDPAEAVADPAMVTARLAHRGWCEAQHQRLNQQLALVTADWLRQKPAAARAFGRAAVLGQLHDTARDTLRNQSETASR